MAVPVHILHITHTVPDNKTDVLHVVKIFISLTFTDLWADTGWIFQVRLHHERCATENWTELQQSLWWLKHWRPAPRPHHVQYIHLHMEPIQRQTNEVAANKQSPSTALNDTFKRSQAPLHSTEESMASSNVHHQHSWRTRLCQRHVARFLQSAFPAHVAPSRSSSIIWLCPAEMHWSKLSFPAISTPPPARSLALCSQSLM